MYIHNSNVESLASKSRSHLPIIRPRLSLVSQVRSETESRSDLPRRASLFLLPFLMGDSSSWVNKILDVAFPWLRDHVVEGLQALVNLEKSKNELLKKMDDLEAKKLDLERDVRQQESPELGRTNEVSLWMQRVNVLKTKVQQFDRDFSDNPFFPEYCCPPGRLWTRFKLIGTAPDLIKDASDLLLSRSKLDPLVAKADWDPHRGISDPGMIDVDDTMKEIHSCLDSDKGMIGIYGMGGVGKTTLLRKIHYELRQSGKFEQPIWVEVPRQVDAAFIRESIGKYLRLPNPESLGAADIRSHLGGKSFVLLLDNLWQELNLADLGLSDGSLGAKRKIVFTTRLKSVCDNMEAHQVKVNVLKPQKARELFKMSVRKEHIFDASPFVEDVVSECGGLPLALKIVGRAMASKGTDKEWRDAAEMLKESPDEIPGVKEKVFTILKFSFDNLDENQKECLLFCALFPDRHDINRTQLSEYWSAEGLLDDRRHRDLSTHHRKGRSVISELISSCLLEEGSNPQQDVRMHDVVRDVALWIAAKRFLVHPRWGASHTDAESWKDAARISIMHSADPVKLPKEVPTCSSISTLLIRHNSRFPKVPERFLSCMPLLRVLDFSGTIIENLPGEIGGLTALQYLNLSHTIIKSLPEELGRLKQLKHLNLSYTARLTDIPNRVMSMLSNLWALNMFHSSYDTWEIGPSNAGEAQQRGISFKELEELSQLQEFGLNIKSLPDLQRFLNSTLLHSTTRLYLAGFLGFSLSLQSTAFDCMTNLQELHIGGFVKLKELTFRRLLNVEILELFDLPQVVVSWKGVPDRRCLLRCLEISGCNELRDLDWIQHLKCLETISLSKCENLKQVMKKEGVDGKSTPVTLFRLKEITIRSLPNLEGVLGPSVTLTSLVSLTCSQCPKLTSFPFSEANATKLVEILGEQGWWDGLRWDSEQDKSHFCPFFKQVAGQ